ncbi:unnamed protein product [Albugo candida]|uniref:Conserved oligomeric Golgi complex subunit 6 n=1 Tax=Albugo candida TaxID=65357 RepID=A0A024G912_9STRA|nr:unnamed protein product [Albugo candida]|eukprot:CCI42807.1 unnamed protein product [Albugo candida]
MSLSPENDRDAVRLRVHKLLQSRPEIESAKSLLNTIIKEGLIAESVSNNISKKHFSSCDHDASYFSTSADPLVELRTTLRATLEKKQLECAKSVLSQLKISLHEIRTLSASVDNLHSQCTAMKSYLTETKKSTGDALVEANRLRYEKESVEHELTQLREFLHRYQLSEEEIQILRSEEKTVEVSDDFFRVMERVQQMKEGCKDLIASENPNLRKSGEFLRPIGMQAQEIIRYCGNLLAWTHQALVTEEDFFNSIFEEDINIQAAMRSEDSTNDKCNYELANVENERNVQTKSVNLVERALDVIARPLHTLVEQCISASHSILTTFKLIHLFSHYQEKMTHLISDGTIVSAISTCQSQAFSLLESQTQSWVAVIGSSGREYSPNLAATPIIVDTSHTLANILKVLEASPNANEECHKAITLILDAISAAVKKYSARLVDEMTPIDALILQLNNFQCLQVQLKCFNAASKWNTLLDEDVDTWKTKLSVIAFNAYLDRWELRSLLSEEMRPKSCEHYDLFSRFMRDFPSNLILLSFSHLSRIAQPETREEIRSLIAQQLENLYTTLYNHLSATAQHDEGSITLEFLRDLRAPQEIKTIIQSI